MPMERVARELIGRRATFMKESRAPHERKSSDDMPTACLPLLCSRLVRLGCLAAHLNNEIPLRQRTAGQEGFDGAGPPLVGQFGGPRNQAPVRGNRRLDDVNLRMVYQCV